MWGKAAQNKGVSSKTTHLEVYPLIQAFSDFDSWVYPVEVYVAEGFEAAVAVADTAGT